jgi:hypothetical protein
LPVAGLLAASLQPINNAEAILKVTNDLVKFIVSYFIIGVCF